MKKQINIVIQEINKKTATAQKYCRSFFTKRPSSRTEALLQSKTQTKQQL